jgi:hypothetical protein
MEVDWSPQMPQSEKQEMRTPNKFQLKYLRYLLENWEKPANRVGFGTLQSSQDLTAG